MTGVRITRRDIETFTQGDCHNLALALHKQTGWPIYSFLEVEFNYEANVHAFVRMPDGNFLDVTGVKSEDQMWEDWGVFCDGDTDWVIGEVRDPSEFHVNQWDDGGSLGVMGEQDYKKVLARAERIAKYLSEKYTWMDSI